MHLKLVNPAHQFFFFGGGGGGVEGVIIKMTLGFVYKYAGRVFSVFRNMPEASVSYRKMAQGQGLKLTFFTPCSCACNQQLSTSNYQNLAYLYIPLELIILDPLIGKHHQLGNLGAGLHM